MRHANVKPVRTLPRKGMYSAKDEPRFAVNDRVRFRHGSRGTGTVIAVGVLRGYTVRWDAGVELYADGVNLERVG